MRKPHLLLLVSLLFGTLGTASLPYHHHASNAEPVTSSAVLPETIVQDMLHVDVTTRDPDLELLPSPSGNNRVAASGKPDAESEPTEALDTGAESAEVSKIAADLTKATTGVSDAAVKGVVRKGCHKNKAAHDGGSDSNGCSCCCCHHEGTPTYHLTMPDPTLEGMATISLPVVGPPYKYGCGDCHRALPHVVVAALLAATHHHHLAAARHHRRRHAAVVALPAAARTPAVARTTAAARIIAAARTLAVARTTVAAKTHAGVRTRVAIAVVMTVAKMAKRSYRMEALTLWPERKASTSARRAMVVSATQTMVVKSKQASLTGQFPIFLSASAPYGFLPCVMNTPQVIVNAALYFDQRGSTSSRFGLAMQPPSHVLRCK
ncbi:hypothetical protein DL89DRAFT_254653 [Linderina pennispora]|uniref:Uncharacterized protein n=1 Tax=Linderina pennispora TaxID=61395 RepID=A0A1Y1WNS5_9FUNG|nr:uncharacterized protein DL89DRAFT_254653 [Linderina pennispora]ORX74886.1 hypothetical protein DL89DRAFT_254653 [Linderina pennispora]